MPSISSQSLFSSVTTEFAVRKVQAIDPKRFNQTLFQMSDQQSRDKSYEKGLEYLRTYIASLQAKANALIEELNGIYETMLSDTLFRRADTKDTAQLLNRLPNADQDSCVALANTYNPKDLEITPYDQNVRFYSYNPLFGSRALDLQNYYNEAQNTDTSIARSYYETNDGLHHELGASAFSTLSYLWMWDLDRINATYATTKDAFIDESGVLHVKPGDVRATQEALNAGIIVEDPTLAIAGGGDPNKLQVNVTALQPNREVFFPDDNSSVSQVDLLKTTVEEAQPLAGWITLSDFSGSQYILNTNATSGNATQQTLNPNVSNLDPYWQDLMQWGVDNTDMILNNPFPPGNPPPLYTEDTAGYNSRHSFQFGNTKVVTYGGVTYAPHSNYIFEPEVINETFDNVVVGGGAITGTRQAGWTATGNTGLIGNDGAAGDDTITGNGDIPGGTPYANAPDPTGITPPDNLNMSYFWTASNGSMHVQSPNFNLSDFEDIDVRLKSYYRVSSYGQKRLFDIDGDYGDSDLDLEIREISKPSNSLQIRETGTNNTWFTTADPAPGAPGPMYPTFFGYATDPYPNYFFTAPTPVTNNQFQTYSYNVAVGTANMGLDLYMKELPSDAGTPIPSGIITGGVDFRRGQNIVANGIYLNHPAAQYIPGVRYEGNINDYATSTRWQVDDVYMKATGFVRGELISPPVDFTNMESGFLEFYDRIETSPTNTIEKKQVWYSLDYNEITKTGTWQLLLQKPQADQAWQKNEVEIPCVADQQNVRVKFVFDTRQNTNIRTSAAGNIQNDTDYDGWNIDDIRLFGVKVDPTDFYYYRQDLNSEFVTGAGPRVLSSTVPLPGLQGINPVAVRTDTDATKLTNNFIATGNSGADAVNFQILNISTVALPPVPVIFNANAAIDTMGVVTQSIDPVVATVPGPHYQALLVTTAPSDSGSGYIDTLTGSNPYLTTGLSAGDKIKISNWEFEILSVGGTTTNPIIIIDPTKTKNNFGVNVTAGLNSVIGLVSSGSPATVSLLSVPTSPTTITTRTLNWDITGTGTTGSTSNASFGFRSIDVDDVTNARTNVSTDDAWAYISNAQGIKRLNPQIRATTFEKPIEMMNNTPLGSTYLSTQDPSSVKTLTGFAGQFAPTDNVNISFSHYANSPSFIFSRRMKIYDESNNLVSERNYDSLIGGLPGIQPESFTLTTAEKNALSLGVTGGRIEFLAEAPDGLRTVFPTNIEDWVVQNFKVEKSTVPPFETHTSSLESGLYNITQSNTKFSFDYSAVDDTTGNISDTKRKVYMYSSSDGGVTFGPAVEILNVAVQTGSTPSFVSTGPIGMSTGSVVKFKFETEITVPSGVTVAARNDVFQVRNLQMARYDGDGYNVAEVPNAPYDSQRPNISFDARRTNLQGKYTVVNNRAQVTNSDFPMFSNAFLTYIEQDAALTNSKLTETYVDWVGENDSPPARVVDAITGRVKSQTDGSFIQRDDGLNQMYDTNSTGGVQDFFVDDAMAINTGRLTNKTTNLDDINKNKTGWINAQDLDGGGGDKIWLPYIAGTKYDELNGTYKSQTIWGKRSFLTDSVNAGAQLSISSNDDAYLYVNGYSVKSTAHAQAGNVVSMINASDYSNNEYVMINGNILRIGSITGNDLNLNAPVPALGLGNFEDSTVGQPATVYHVDLPLDLANNAITVLGTTVPDKIQLTSLNQINIGQTITIAGENYKISAVNIMSNTITVTPANLSINPIPAGSIVYFGLSDKGPASNPSAPGAGLINTNTMSPAVPYNVAPLLRTGFNTVGFKASEDRGTGEGVSITASNITAIGDTNGPNGIDTDSRWAVKIQEKGYDGVVPVSTSTVNPYSNSLSQEEVVELFKSEKLEKKELTVKFINQDQNGVGRLSHIQSIDVRVTGEPLIGTFKTTNYSTESYIDGLVTTQLEKGYIRGVAQDGNGAALVFDPTLTNDPDNPTVAPTNSSTGLRYTTGADGLADVNVFLEKDDNIVNDATLMVQVDYYEDGNGDGVIDGDTNKNGLIENTIGEVGTLKTKYIGMQDLRQNLPSNPKGNSAGGAIGLGPNAMVDRYQYSQANILGAIALGGTVLTVPVADISKFSIGDDLKIVNGVNNQTVQITAINTGTGQITFQPYTGTGLGFATVGITTVSNNYALSDIDPNYAIRMYSGADKFNIGANTTVHSMNLTATNGRSGGANVTGNQNKLTTRLKSILDNAEYADVIKYNLLDEIYISATASDNRGDQVIGKLILNWDWQRKRLGLTQGSFSAVYKS